MIIQADSRHIPLRDESVNCVVTSPPYWGLRDYGIPGQIGLEPTPEAYVQSIVGVFREVWRVLRSDGVAWLNLGDSYCAPRGNTEAKPGAQTKDSGNLRGLNYKGRGPVGALKVKDLCGIPWRCAFALQADGWYLRSDTIWAKPNPMPESVKDRPTRSHEYVFLLTKAERYFYDAEAIKEPSIYAPTAKIAGIRPRGHKRPHEGFNGKWDSMTKAEQGANGRNKRSVWTIATEPTPFAHFATFPRKLVKTCILAGCPEGGIVLDPFVGSGTTVRVAESLNRKGIGLDLSMEYLSKIATVRTRNVQRQIVGL